MDSFPGQSKHSDWLLMVEGGESARKLIASWLETLIRAKRVAVVRGFNE